MTDIASDLARALPDPVGWGFWLMLLLGKLEKQAAEQSQPVERYDLILELLKSAIRENL